MIAYLSQYHIFTVGMAASVAAGLATGAGALPIFFTGDKVSQKVLDGMLGFAAGVMLAATSFSLVVPAIEYGGGGVQGALITAAGILLGGLFLDQADQRTPHLHFIKGREGISSELLRIWLFVLAITIHNLPEGLAVGVGFGNGDIANGLTLAIGIGLQNMPEGLAVAVALLRERYTMVRAFLVALLTGLVEPLGAPSG